MNIKDFTPKSVVLADVKAAAKTYKGSFEELNQLVEAKEITLVTDEGGNVNGIWVNSGSTDPMVDAISGENFQRAYGCKPTMSWLNTILTVHAEGRSIMYAGTNTFTDSNGNIFNLDGTPYVAPKEEETEETSEETSEDTLPYEVDISYSKISDCTEAAVNHYLRVTWHNSLAKGSVPDMEYTWHDDYGYVTVSNIHWGRKLTQEEVTKMGD